MLHYHGTPITPAEERQKMAGKNFCVSFADARDADWCLAHGQSVMWDNGRFSQFTQGKVIDDAKLYTWLEPRVSFYHWAVVPDVIDGWIDEQKALVAQWPFSKMVGAPVWHMGLSIDYLLDLADNWPRICFGSTRQYWQVGSDQWCRRSDEAFNALAHAGLNPAVHMLRGLSLCGDRWPFASGDSVNVARNFKNVGSETCPERMARRIDAIQSPIRWTVRPLQKDMFNVA